MEPSMMEYLVAYDVETITPEGQRRLRQVAKICEGYGLRVQKSVFEVTFTRAQLPAFRQKLADVIQNSTDSIRLYHLPAGALDSVELLGIAAIAPHSGDHIL
jgi:CRISPR-associated protein Cas2